MSSDIKTKTGFVKCEFVCVCVSCPILMQVGVLASTDAALDAAPLITL